MRYIVVDDSGWSRKYQTPRRNTGKMYESRTDWSLFIDDARIFQTRGAATNSAKQSGVKEFTVLPVELRVVEDVASGAKRACVTSYVQKEG